MVNSLLTPYSAPLFAGGILMLGLAIMAWSRRAARGSSGLALVCLALALYVTGYAFEISSQSLAEVRFWLKIEYLGIATLPGFVLAAATLTAGIDWFRRRLNLTLLFFIPAISLLFAWTNETNDALWRNLSIDTAGPFTMALFERGLWYYVNTAYAFLIMIAAVIVLARTFWRETGLYRRQLAVMLVGLLVPFAAYALYMFHATPPGLDLNAYAQLVGIAIVAWGMLSHQILDIGPIAQEIIFANMRDAVLVFDARDRLVDLNPVARQLVAQATIGDGFATVANAWPDLAGLAAKLPLNGPISTPARHAQQVFEVSVTPLLDKQGKRLGHLLSMRDTTEWAQTQVELQESNERQATLRKIGLELSRKLKVSYVAQMATDAALRISRADAALLALIDGDGYRVASAIGAYPPDQYGQLIKIGEGIAARALQRREPELTLDVAADPDYLKIIESTRAQITAPLVSGGEALGVLVLETSHPDYFTEEIFETIKLLAAGVAVAVDNAMVYEERDHLVQELESFAHTVAHDLKNPLSGIRSMAEMMMISTPEKIKKFAPRVYDSANQSMKIVDALLLLARVRSEGKVEMSPVDMWAAVKNVESRLSPIVEKYGARLIYPDEWPTATGYGPWVEEIWANYISNALKYGGDPPEVRLGWDAQPDQRVRFWVKDNGKGLTEAQARTLFQPFTRLDSGRAEGHGLGLSIVQRIAERLHGEAGVESAPGEGSRFYFMLPGDGVDKAPKSKSPRRAAKRPKSAQKN